MKNIYMLNEIITDTQNHHFLSLVFILSILSGILVITSKNPIVSVLFLIGLFLTIAFYLMMLGANFIGLSYLLVYIGAVSILFLFILMLINVRVSELVVSSKNSILLAIMIGIFFHLALAKDYLHIVSLSVSDNNNHTTDTRLIADIWDYLIIDLYDDNTFTNSHIWEVKPTETSHITGIGDILYTNSPIWLILTSTILLLAMIGSILITIKQ